MPKLLLLSDWFSPAYLAGGPIRSCENLAFALREDYEMIVITGDRDLNQSQPLLNIKVNEWLPYDSNIKIQYLSPKKQNLLAWMQLLRGTQTDFLYCNSMFSLRFTLLPLLCFLIGLVKTQVVLAPRGMLRESALAFKPLKKSIFLTLIRWSGVARRIRFHATDTQEAYDIQKHLGVSSKQVFVLPNFPPAKQSEYTFIKKTPGELDLLYLARIHPIKNLHLVLQALADLPHPHKIKLSIYGPEEDSAYWLSCEARIKKLPSNVEIVQKGAVHHQEVDQILKKNHLYILPTSGENFGHSIFESFLAGRPVVISDQTPWRNLATQKLGYDLPLSHITGFVQAISFFATMDQEAYNEWATASWKYAAEHINNLELKKEYLSLFS